MGDYNCGNLYRLGLAPERDSLLLASTALSDRVADNSGAACAAEMDEIRFGGGWGGLTDLEVGPDGSLYALSFGLVGPMARASGNDAEYGGVRERVCPPGPMKWWRYQLMPMPA